MDDRFKGLGKSVDLIPNGDNRSEMDEDGNLSYIVRYAHRSLSRVLQARVGAHNVSMAQWFFLRVLWVEDGLTQRELSQRVGMMEPTTVAAVNMMERRGLVRRIRNEHDRRKVNIHLTAKGAGLRTVLFGAGAEVNALAVDGIEPAEVEGAITVLLRVIANLSGSGSLAVPAGVESADAEMSADTDGNLSGGA